MLTVKSRHRHKLVKDTSLAPSISRSVTLTNRLHQLRTCCGGVSDCVEIALGGVSGSGTMTVSGDEIKMH